MLQEERDAELARKLSAEQEQEAQPSRRFRGFFGSSLLRGLKELELDQKVDESSNLEDGEFLLQADCMTSSVVAPLNHHPNKAFSPLRMNLIIPWHGKLQLNLCLGQFQCYA